MAIALQKTNFAKSNLASSITSVATSLTLTASTGTKFPASGNFRAVIWGATFTTPENDPNREIVTATLNAADTFNITRAQESTSASAWNATDNFALVVTKGVFDEIETDINLKAYSTAAITHVHHEYIPKPKTADTTSVVATVNLTNTTLTLATQPDYPRNVVITIVDTTPSITVGTVTVTGTLADGSTAQTEVFNCAAGAGTYTGAKAFAKITSIVTTSFATLGGAGDETIAVGVGTKLGLSFRGTLVSVFKACVDNADETVGTVSTTYGTIIPTSVPNGTRVYDFYYTLTRNLTA